MNELIFDQKQLINGNIFKFEERLHTKMNRFASNGSVLATYFSQDETSTTVDRGTQSIDMLFGKGSPLRYNEIIDLPINGLGATNPENNDELQVEDINVEGEVTILPSTIVPKNMDFFMLNHLGMCALFEVIDVSFDSMKVDGFYKIRYHLHSTSPATVENLRKQVVKTYHVDMNEVGGKRDAVILEDDFVYREKVISMMNQMIEVYRSLYYDTKHNCFLYHDNETGLRWFDLCGNEFIAKHGLMNPENSSNVIILHDKVDEHDLPLLYQQSIYSWLELHAPSTLLQKFPFRLVYADKYLYSSFVMWHEGDIQIIHPMHPNKANQVHVEKIYTIFDGDQLNALQDKDHAPVNEYEKLIWMYIHKQDITIHDISMHVADMLLAAMDQREIFLYTPIIIYIIRDILDMH